MALGAQVPNTMNTLHLKFPQSHPLHSIGLDSSRWLARIHLSRLVRKTGVY